MGRRVLLKSFWAIKGKEVREDRVQKADSAGQSRTELCRLEEQGFWHHSASKPH